jgi:hypothetical protein
MPKRKYIAVGALQPIFNSITRQQVRTCSLLQVFNQYAEAA